MNPCSPDSTFLQAIEKLDTQLQDDYKAVKEAGGDLRSPPPGSANRGEPRREWKTPANRGWWMRGVAGVAERCREGVRFFYYADDEVEIGVEP